MNKLKLVSSLFALFMVVTACSSQAQAQATRTWVSGVGDDANPCSRTAPCKTFAGAISKTAAGGEISVLDPGGFGTVTITKSITINGDGQIAGVLSAGTNGIVVNAAATDKVILKNLSIVGAGTGLDGIRFLAGNQLVVENVQISNVTGDGIEAALTNGGRLFVRNVNITACGGSGIKISTAAGVATASLDDVRIQNVVNGVEVGAGSNFVMIQRSSLVSNSSNGILAATSPAVISVENSTIAFNTNGVNASVAGTTIRISGNGIYNNTQGVKFVAGAVVESDGTNKLGGNGSSQAPNSVIAKQ
ncbi:MAG TPA: right-handed parallel beta-helix repeat-containing protein [Blastocatellia bacterium]|nr:right-handed parallel beta-helix repeat-containing protein [Blastocatellia bacterium]